MTNKLDNQPSHERAENHVTPGLREVPDPGRKWWVRCLMQVLWPAFLGASITVGLIFSLIDPLQIEWVHIYLHDSREAAYTAGFILFWIVYALACTLTWFLATTETPADRVGHQRRS
ncbi:MAG: hypothetical protein AB8B97_27290 [Granulosicoccus sp.]